MTVAPPTLALIGHHGLLSVRWESLAAGWVTTEGEVIGSGPVAEPLWALFARVCRPLAGPATHGRELSGLAAGVGGRDGS